MDFSMRLGLRQEHLLAIAHELKRETFLDYAIVCPARSGLADRASAMELTHLPVNGTNPYSPFVMINLLNLFGGLMPGYVHVFGGNAATALRNCMICRNLSATLIFTQSVEEDAETDAPKDCLLARGRFSMVRKILCPSVEAVRTLRAMGVRDDLPESLPLNRDPAAVVLRPRRPGDHFVFLCRADATPRNGIETLLGAMARLDGMKEAPPWELRVIGDYGDFARILHLAEELKVERHLCLLGRQDDAEQMSMADACVLPLTAPRHLNPFLLLAMNAGIPVVTSNISTSMELVGIGTENALVYDADDAETLASHMLRLMMDDGLRRRLSDAGRAEAPKHTPQAAARTVVGIYRDLVEGVITLRTT